MARQGDGLTLKNIAAEARERKEMQEQIIGKYGKPAIWAAMTRLCDNCTRPCRGKLMPLTGSGKDCPYFTKKEVENV